MVPSFLLNKKLQLLFSVIGFAVIIGASAIFTINIRNGNPMQEAPKEIAPPQTKKDDSPTSEGFTSRKLTYLEKEEYPEPTPKPESVSIPETEPEPESEPQPAPIKISLSGPEVNEEVGKVEYTYKLSLNSTAKDKYDYIEYQIEADGCDIDGMFDTSTDFSEKVTNLKTDNSIKIVILEDYLKSKSDLREVGYKLKNNGATILEGKIDVPRCQEAPDYGKFRIEGPLIDDYANIEGKYHFQYNFIFDDKAKSILEKGYTHKLNHDCEKYLDGQGYFTSEWDPGGMSSGSGFAEHIDHDWVPENDKTEDSTYEIIGYNGDTLFSGSVEVPNCK